VTIDLPDSETVLVAVTQRRPPILVADVIPEVFL
jgi:hypothetical protein